jgi:hypothetical protein
VRKSRTACRERLLRQQLIVLRRQIKRPTCTTTDRLLLVLLAKAVRTWRQALYIVQPETLLRWHRQAFRVWWKRKSKAMSTRPVLATSFVTSHTSTAFTFYMRCIILFSASQRQSAWDVSARISRNRQYSTQRLHKQSMDEASPTHFPGASGTLAVYRSRVQHTREAPGLQTGARREADAPHGALNCIIDREKDAGVVASCFRNGWCKLRNQHNVTSPH